MTLPRRHWGSLETQREFLEEAARRLGFSWRDQARWYALDSKALIALGGSPLLKRFHWSLPRLLATVFSEFSWDPLRFPKAPRGFWSDVRHQRAFMDELAPQLGLETGVEGWYGVDNKTLIAHGGASLLKRYGNSLVALLTAVYPEHRWEAARFTTARRGHYADVDRQRHALDAIAHELFGAQSVADLSLWYGVEVKQVRALRGGASLLRRHGGSLSALLAALYPEYPWQPWRFARSSHTVLSDAAVSALLQEAEKALGIVAPSDWYRVSLDQLRSLGLALHLGKRSTLIALLSRRYPAMEWKARHLLSSAHSKQTRRAEGSE